MGFSRPQRFRGKTMNVQRDRARREFKSRQSKRTVQRTSIPAKIKHRRIKTRRFRHGGRCTININIEAKVDQFLCCRFEPPVAVGMDSARIHISPTEQARALSRDGVIDQRKRGASRWSVERSEERRVGKRV